METNPTKAVADFQAALGEINASITTLGKSVDSTKSKIEDLVKWKNMILGGAIVLGVAAGIAVAKLSVSP